MTTDTAEKIIKYIGEKGQTTAKDLKNYLGISSQALFKQFAKLLENKKIYKVGRPPKVFYYLNKALPKANIEIEDIDEKTRKILEDSFLNITPKGERKQGVEGFALWCQKTRQPLEKTAREYVSTLEKYNAFKKNGVIDGIKKFRSSFPQVFLDHIFYLDFYSIERFGKTKLGQMLLYAKQSQNKVLIKELISDIEPQIQLLIKEYDIDAVGFIPPTVKREIQFMKELENNSLLSIPKIKIVKVKTEIAVPQKTLSKIEDRIENARSTIIVDENQKYKNILLVDDAVGSGATLNETASQIKDKDICRGKIIGLAITGSFKGFDVISEV
ncbi:hypothetical protein KJ657_00480 [Patescibacteria group bacterium]|nr:hypothetical protein [Patescibacteria group bacterium]MBU1015552.1 hypothetical protein [Patescibacteria group bacterium]MBU1685603.1 hypothetical protein [Patescibacteria group bacterium]MBU1938979.1 hypothetical protein [Patescibacteria group bacterium]